MLPEEGFLQSYEYWIFYNFGLLGILPTNDKTRLDLAREKTLTNSVDIEQKKALEEVYLVLNEEIEKGFNFYPNFTVNDEFQHYYPEGKTLFAVEMNRFAIKLPEVLGGATYVFGINAPSYLTQQKDSDFIPKCFFVGIYPQVDHFIAYGISECLVSDIKTNDKLKAVVHIDCATDLGFTLKAVTDTINQIAEEYNLEKQKGHFKFYGTTLTSFEILMNGFRFEKPQGFTYDLTSRLQNEEDEEMDEESDLNIIEIFFDNPLPGDVKIVNSASEDVTHKIKIPHPNNKRAATEMDNSFFPAVKRRNTGEGLSEIQKKRPNL